MAEYGFYHLTRTPMEQALPRLLGRVLAAEGRAVVPAQDTRRGNRDS
ncbi:DNA polymerase III subunit chi [Leptolyngbya sp. 15MV]|nr:DNA polymerase III subunit chi [Leptolyngbya sp. 15MV]